MIHHVFVTLSKATCSIMGIHLQESDGIHNLFRLPRKYIAIKGILSNYYFSMCLHSMYTSCGKYHMLQYYIVTGG